MVSKASVTFAPIEEEELRAIHGRQYGLDQNDISEWFEVDPFFKPMTIEELKKKLDEERGKDRTMVVAVKDEGRTVGVATWTSGWDPWSPAFGVLIWSDERRKGYATAAARLLLDHTFQSTIARSVQGFWVNDFNAAGLAFAASVGFKEQGRLRRTGVREGRFHDSAVFDMLREEYVELRKGW